MNDHMKQITILIPGYFLLLIACPGGDAGYRLEQPSLLRGEAFFAHRTRLFAAAAVDIAEEIEHRRSGLVSFGLICEAASGTFHLVCRLFS